jgi:hypothetical protein
LRFDKSDNLGANGAESRDTHFQGCDHDALNLPENGLS